MAIVGASFDDLKGKDFISGAADFSDQGRARVKGENQGLVRIYAAPKSGVILGAEMAAPEGEHLAHLLAWAIADNLTVDDLLRKPFYHPTVEEALRTALRNVQRFMERH